MGSQWSGNETDAREGMRGLKAELEGQSHTERFDEGNLVPHPDSGYFMQRITKTRLN